MYVISLIKSQRTAGQNIAAFVLPQSRIDVELRAANVPVFYAQCRSHFHLADIRTLRQLLHKHQFEIIHSHTSTDVWPTSIAATGFRNLAHVTSVYVVTIPKHDPHHWLIYKKVDAVISSSTYTNARLERDLPIAPKKIHLVRYGRHLEAFRPSPNERYDVRSQYGIPMDSITFGMIGRLDPQKGVREFAESLLELPSDIRSRVTYLIIGKHENADCEMNVWLDSFKQHPQVNGRLFILPFAENIVPYFNALDVLVLASYREMYSLSVIEAMAMRLPVIGTDREGTTEQIGKNERGILIEPHSPKAIADAVCQYVENPVLRVKHGEAGHYWVHREHAMDRMLESLGNVYSCALERRVGSTASLTGLTERS